MSRGLKCVNLCFKSKQAVEIQKLQCTKEEFSGRTLPQPSVVIQTNAVTAENVPETMTYTILENVNVLSESNPQFLFQPMGTEVSHNEMVVSGVTNFNQEIMYIDKLDETAQLDNTMEAFPMNIQSKETLLSNEDNIIMGNSFSAAVDDLNLTGVSDVDFLLSAEDLQKIPCDKPTSAAITFPLDDDSLILKGSDDQFKQTVETLPNSECEEEEEVPERMTIDTEECEQREEKNNSGDESKRHAENGLSKIKTRKSNKRLENKKQRNSGVHKKIKPNPCANKKCQNNCKSVSETDRQQIFNDYYNLNSYDEKKSWLIQCMKQKEIGRKRTKNDHSKKTRTIEYYLTIQGEKRRVCQQFILKTLDISQMSLRQTIDNVSKTGMIKKDSRGRCAPKNKKTEGAIKTVRDFIEKIPVVPSHYCRLKTKKLYMTSDIRNLSNLYRLYKEDCHVMQNTDPVGRATFFRVFKNYNLGIHVPKKDKCNLCENVKSIGETNLEAADKTKYLRHREEIENSRIKFKKDQEIRDPNFICASFDLQKVLTTPHGNSILLYYARKLAVYNFTVYESTTKNGFCFLWNETLGKKGSNEICTALNRYLHLLDQRVSPEVYELSLYCDNCSGQNKNKQVLAMINRFLKTAIHLKKITLNYLIAGHTYMPVDSMHSTIESFISKKTIYAPSMWKTAISLARHTPGPYCVHLLNYDNFMNYSTIAKCISNFSLPEINVVEETSTGEQPGPVLRKIQTKNKNKKKAKLAQGKPLKISQIRMVEMEGENSKYMIVKYSYLEEFANKQMFTIKDDRKPLKRCYTSLLPISAAKHKDLMKLCLQSVIPSDYHAEYATLPHSGEIVDELPDTDEEDEVDA